MIRFALAFWLALCGVANAQLAGGLQFPGPGTVHSAGYIGPGDVKSGATFWYSCARAYNAAYALAGSKACNICDVADAHCQDVNVASDGSVTIPLIGGVSDCSIVVCTIKTFYDQSGAGSCSGPCDQTLGVIASRAVLTMSALGGRACGTFSAASPYVVLGYTGTPSQPFTGSIVGKRSLGTSNDMFLGDGSGGGAAIGFLGTKYGMFSSFNFTTSASADNNYHSFAYTGNGASSRIVVDSTTDTGNPGTQAFITAIRFGGDAFSENLHGVICEAGIWAGFSAGDDVAMAANQHSTTNGYNF